MVLTSVSTNLDHISLSLGPHSRQVMMDTDYSCKLPRGLRLLVFLKDVAWISGVSDGDVWKEEDKEASAAGADAALWLSGRSVPARMSVCRVSPDCPPAGAQLERSLRLCLDQ